MVLLLLDMYGLNSLFSRQKFFAPHGGRPRLSAGAEPLPRPSVQTRAGVTHLFVELSFFLLKRFGLVGGGQLSYIIQIEC